MSEATQTAPTTAPFEKMMRDWQNTTMENWGALSRQMVGADSFFNLMSASMDLYLSSIKQMRGQMGDTLKLFEIPQMSDLARVSNQVLTAEIRVVECEEQLDRARREMTDMEQRMRELEALVAELKGGR